MADVQRLKRKATELEQKRQLDKALEVYIQLLDEAGRDLPDLDVPLYNRVGDLLMRQNDVSGALEYYERAVDAYAERGFLSNAIALCNKILRQSPGRTSVYYKLGKISARKGFKSDARKAFLEYADRMQKGGHLDEAFRALKEFASLYPDQDDVRLILADLLSKENRKGEALEQLQALYEKLEVEGREVEARATVDRMKAIDPDVTPRSSGRAPVRPAADLVFLDLGSQESPARSGSHTSGGARSSSGNIRSQPLHGLASALDGLKIAFVPEEDIGQPTPVRLEGLEPTNAGDDARAGDERSFVERASAEVETSPALDGLEGVSGQSSQVASSEYVVPSTLEGFETTAVESQRGPESVAPTADAEPANRGEGEVLTEREFATLDLADAEPRYRAREHDLALPSALPTLERGYGAADQATSGTSEAHSPVRDDELAAAADERAALAEAQASDSSATAGAGRQTESRTDIDGRVPGDRSAEEGDFESRESLVDGADRGDISLSMRAGFAPDSTDSWQAAAESALEEWELAARSAGTEATNGPARATEHPTPARPERRRGTPSHLDAATNFEERSASDRAARHHEAPSETSSDESIDDLLSRPPRFSEAATEDSPAFPPLSGLSEEVETISQEREPRRGSSDSADDEEDALAALTGEEESLVAADLEEPVDAPLPAGLEEVTWEENDSGSKTAATSAANDGATGRANRAVLSFGGAEAHLRRRLELEPENWVLRRQLGEALLDAGERDAGLYELELAMAGYDLAQDLDRAQEIVDVILRVMPGSVRHHQKRVEFAVRTQDRGRLVEAYLELADALFRTGEAKKAIDVYGRVMELDPGNDRAMFAIATLAPGEPGQAGSSASSHGRPSDEMEAIDYEAPLRITPGNGSGPSNIQTDAVAATPAAPQAASEGVVEGAGSVESAWGLADADALPPEQPAPPPDPDWSLPVSAEVPGATSEQGHAPAIERHATSDPRAEVRAKESVVPQTAGPEAAAAEAAAAEAAAAEAAAAEAAAAEAAAAEAAAPDESVIEPDAPRGEAEVAAAGSSSETWFGGDVAPNTPASSAATQETVAEAVAAPPAMAGATTNGSSAPASGPPTWTAAREESVGANPALAPRHEGLLERARRLTPIAGSEIEYVDLGDWLRRTEPAKSTRMVVQETPPSGDEQADFEEMLRRFKRGVAESVDAEDFEAHYDLGVAYKEMGLVDEAIAEFQKALRGSSYRVRAFEALGQCFVEKGQYPIAAALLQRGVETPGTDDDLLVGVLYLLGYASEQMGRQGDALRYYQRVFAVDIAFRDVAQRVAAMELLTK